MTNTRRMFPIVTLVGLILFSAAFATIIVEQNQFPLFLLLFLIGLMFWIYWMGGGWRVAEKDTVVIVEDFTRTAHPYTNGSYLYIPIVNAIAAKMPTYPIFHEFEVDAIDTRTPKLLQIKQIMVSVTYTISNFELCYDKSAEVKQLIKDLERADKLQPDNPALWIRALSTRMEATIEAAIRKAVWEWATTLAQDPNLQLQTPFPRSLPAEHDPYSLSLNRHNLSKKVMEQVYKDAMKWGVRVTSLAFAHIELDQQIIDRATRDRDREIAEAKHQAAKEAAAIRERGLAEVEVRAAMVTKIIEALMSQPHISVTDQMLYNIVRAAMYSDGQMIWHSTMEKGAAGSVKAA